MKKITICVCAFLWCMLLYSQEKVKGGYSVCNVFYYEYKDGKIDLNSKYKFSRSTYDASGNRTEYISYEQDGSITNILTYKYDDKGNLIEGTQDRKATDYQKASKLTYKENKDECVYYDEDGSINEKQTYSYNSDGSLSMAVAYNADGSIDRKRTYSYNSDGSLRMEVSYSEDGSIVTTSNYTYDKNGKLIACKETNWQGATTTKYKYDKTGEVVEESSSKEGGSMYDGKRINKYDDNGRLSESICYDSNKRPKDKFEYIYY